MQEFSRPLSDAVKKARSGFGLTQGQLAEKINIDQRTILNIENCKGNPKMKVLYPLVRALKIDAREIFNPEMERLTIETCSEAEAAVLISVVDAVLNALRSGQAVDVRDIQEDDT